MIKEDIEIAIPSGIKNKEEESGIPSGIEYNRTEIDLESLGNSLAFINNGFDSMVIPHPKNSNISLIDNRILREIAFVVSCFEDHYRFMINDINSLVTSIGKE